jgi:hypothetical protein
MQSKVAKMSDIGRTPVQLCIRPHGEPRVVVRDDGPAAAARAVQVRFELFRIPAHTPRTPYRLRFELFRIVSNCFEFQLTRRARRAARWGGWRRIRSWQVLKNEFRTIGP